jgi:hypothetical protein
MVVRQTEEADNRLSYRQEHGYANKPVFHSQTACHNPACYAGRDNDECQGRKEKVDKECEDLEARGRRGRWQSQKRRSVHDATQ